MKLRARERVKAVDEQVRNDVDGVDNASVPRHHRVASAIREHIARQGLPEHSKLPSEVALARQYGVSRGTVTKAMDTLVQQGVVYRRRPRGTFVAARPGADGASAQRQGVRAPATSTIGLLVPYLPDSFIGSIILGVEAVTRSARYRLTFTHSENDWALERYHVEQLLQEGIAGIVMFPGDHPVARRDGGLVSAGELERVDTLRHLQRRGVPFVLIDRYVPEVDCDYVVSDDTGAGYMATQHLVSLGHRRIGFVSDNAQITSIAGRYAGYRQCLREHDFPFDDSLVMQEERHALSYGAAGAAPAAIGRPADRAALQTYLRAEGRPSAVVTTNEYVGLHVLQAAEDIGLAVPRDLAIVSCGGANISAHARVPLTSIVQPTMELGRQAAHMLLDRIAGRASDARHLVLPVNLVVRRSCGAIPLTVPLTT